MNESSFYGNVRYLTIIGDVQLNQRAARGWVLSATTGGLKAKLPRATLMSPGAPALVVINDGANSIIIADFDGTTVTTLLAGRTAIFGLFSNTTDAGTWKVITRVNGTGNVALGLTSAFVSGGNPTNATYVWNEGSWTTGTASPNAHIEGAVMPIGPSGFFVGSDPGNANNDELKAGAWTARTPMPLSVAKPCAAFADGRGFIFSGDGSPKTFAYFPDAWVEKTSIGMVLTRGTAKGMEATRPASTHRATAFILAGEPVPRPHLAYRAPTDCFYGVTSFASSSRYGLCSFTIDHLLYAVGGKLDGVPSYFSNVDEYNPLTNVWTAKTALGSGVRHRACGVTGNRRGLVFGGRDGAEAQKDTASAFLANAWTALATMPGVKSEVANNGVSL